MPGAELLDHLSRRVDGRIDRPEQAILGVLEGRCEFREPDVADDHQIDVARRAFVLVRDRAVDECHIDAVRKPARPSARMSLSPRSGATIREDRRRPGCRPRPGNRPGSCPPSGEGSPHRPGSRARAGGSMAIPRCAGRDRSEYHSRAGSINVAARTAWRVLGNKASRTFFLRILRKIIRRTNKNQVAIFERCWVPDARAGAGAPPSPPAGRVLNTGFPIRSAGSCTQRPPRRYCMRTRGASPAGARGGMTASRMYRPGGSAGGRAGQPADGAAGRHGRRQAAPPAHTGDSGFASCRSRVI